MEPKKINGKLFQFVSSHTIKSIAQIKATKLRGKGKLVRILRGKSKQGKNVYQIFKASSGGIVSKKGQQHLGSFGRRVIKASGRQTGTSNRLDDLKRSAMRPGKRRSASGNIYYENRRDRSDLKGRKV